MKLRLYFKLILSATFLDRIKLNKSKELNAGTSIIKLNV
jgi:hypothetical protein